MAGSAKDDASDTVGDLIRACATRLLSPGDETLRVVEQAVVDRADPPFRDDPGMSEEIRASARESFRHWLGSVAADPFGSVEPMLTPVVLGISREGFRRGAERNVWSTFGAGRAEFWRQWMRTMFDADPDRETLSEALDVSAETLNTWIDSTVDGVSEHLERERADLTRGTHAQRLETVSLILNGAPMRSDRATHLLGHPMETGHVAAVLWVDPGNTDQTILSRAAERLRRGSAAHAALTISVSPASTWVWLAGEGLPDPVELSTELRVAPEIRLAMGAVGFGLAGFSRSHFEAVETQRVMMRTNAGQIATFDEVALVALVTRDEQAAREFVSRTLGEFGTASPASHETVRIYIREQFSATRAAAALYTHRNTVLNRIRRAEELLPHSLTDRALDVGVALEVARWFTVSD